MLQLRLLGVPEVLANGSSVTEKLPSKAQAILYYLAVTGQPQTRTVLATLLWGDMPESAARTNLRKALAALRQELDAYLQIERQSVAFHPEIDLWVDTVEFENTLDDASTKVNSARWQAAVDLYQGDFLSGFYVRKAPDFEAWMYAEQGRLRELMIQVLHTLTTYHAEQGDLGRGIATVRRLLNLEPWREEAHRRLMLLLTQDGQRSAALAQFETCRQVLEDELGVEPGPETVTLYEQIRTGELSRGAREQGGRDDILSPAPLPPRPLAPLLNLPAQATPFVGREKELADIIRRLTDRDCRLLTLVGPGGIGKTRLALQTAQKFVETGSGEDFFPHGLVFVSLAGISSNSSLVSAIAEAAKFSFYSSLPPKQQLLDYLKEKKMLLILDNLEHILTGGTELIADILAAAPAVKILVTSREALNLQEAWFHPVEGMPFPRIEPQPTGSQKVDLYATASSLESYDSVRLFVQSASRARLDFSLAAEQAHVMRICQLVEGMPLAIELAAAWLKMLPTKKIVREIERGLDFLTSRHQNVPARHRSIRAAFEHSWNLLADEECSVLKQLSVFRSSFDQEAAEQIAEASLPILAVLVEKSLLRVTETGRYQMHELLRQFAAEKLAEDSPTALAVQKRHSAYYLDFLKAREAMLTGKEQPNALNEIGIEIDNIQTGWRRTVEQGHITAIEQGVDALYNFYEIRGRYQEGEEIFAQTISRLQQVEDINEHPNFEVVLNRLAARRGAFYHFLGEYEAANKYLLKSLNSVRQSNEMVFALTMLGEVAKAQTKPSLAEEQLHKSLVICREIGDQQGVAKSLQGLAGVKSHFGDHAAAVDLAREGLAISRQLGRPDLIAHALWALAWPTNCLGAYRESEAHWQESLTISQKIGNQWGVAISLSFLGWVAWCIGGSELNDAIDHYQQALTIYRQIGDRQNISMSYGDLALATSELGNYELAVQYGRKGLDVAREVGDIHFIIYNLYSLGTATCGLDDFQTSRNYLVEALNLAWENQKPDQTMNILFYFATLLMKESHNATGPEQFNHQKKIKALELLDMVIGHPTTWQGIKDRAARLLAQLEVELPADVLAATKLHGQNKTPDKVVTELLQR